MDFDILTKEEKFQYGSWLYTIMEGWKDPNWWSKHNAEQFGHVFSVNITAP